MSNAKDFATVVLPAVTQFELPRPLARKLLDLGMRLLVHDNASGKFIAGPNAEKVATALLDDDAVEGKKWVGELVAEYNAYVDGAIGAGGATTFFIP